MDGPILFSASTSLRAKGSNAYSNSRFVEGKSAIIKDRDHRGKILWSYASV